MARTHVNFTSRLSKKETVAVLAWLPVHLWLLPLLLQQMINRGAMDDVAANVICYTLGVLYMLGLLFPFLRRDFDPLCDRPGYCLLEILGNYGLMYLCNLVIAGLMTVVLGQSGENPNNAGLMEMAGRSWNQMSAMAVFMAPIVEECLFRAGIFGTLRRYSRWAAYLVATLAFSLYHVWSYAMIDPTYWLYFIQYVPVSLLLCRVYERTNSIWGSIFFHMLVNYIAMNALKALEALL